ncbi:MAG: AAA family ATPase [Candidatus Bathyarchaeota archaeon]|uniref:AAA family ATPase n=2 Tax=Candidatus Bathycorpusculum sp. TaxID=2994959 RepID=UPI00282AFAF8|nr:AAA family ATPase [Candidatus Termiticorpusculum sp.]MCL2292851.1 AAA family ATPase [Candidatus Termiticorpusculum sp.]
MSIQRRIGLAYLSGALPCFEDFGNLPTDLVPEKGLINGKPASEVLDMLILPSGSLLESQSVSPAVSGEILKMSAAGKFVLGIGSGLQVLAKQTIRDSSTDSIMRKGLGLINATIQPLICTDQVKAHIIDKSFLGNDVDVELSGFHCHTYGKTILHSDSKPVLVSHIEHANYRKAPQNLVSGIANKEGNIVGLLVHALLDQNPAIIAGITKSLDIDPLELQEIRKANAKLTLEIKNEIGINTSIQPAKLAVKKAPVMVLITALGSGSGKTFLVTGMAGALRKRGYNVGLIKVGGDVRDSVPALYLVKAPMKRYCSIKISESGWTPVHESIKQACVEHDFLFVEGAMSAFTGLLNSKISRPASTLEVAASLGAPVIVVVTCDKEGVEGGLVNVLNYINVLKLLGVNPVGVILNKMSTSYLTEEDKLTIQQAFKNVDVKVIGVVPSLKFERREMMIPEVEICYTTFCSQAVDVVERYINLDQLVELAKTPKQVNVDYTVFVEKFKKLLTNYSYNFS